MRFLILATDLHTRGGIARYTAALATTLGHAWGPNNVDVLSFHDWGTPPATLQPYRLLGMMGPKATPGTRARFVAAAWEAAQRDDPYTLIIANHVVLAPVAWLLRARHRIPYWVLCHSIEVWWGMSWMERVSLRNADRVLAVSRFTARRIATRQGVAPDRLRVVRAGFGSQLEPSRGAPRSYVRQPGERILFTVCSLVPGNEFKGVDTMIRLLPRLRQRVPRLRYVVAGFGAGRARLENMAQQAGVGAAVCFAGEVDDQELSRLFHDCDAFVLLSRGQSEQGRFGGEGFGRAYVEAAWAGRPVIGSNRGGAEDAVCDGINGILVDPTDLDAIEAAIVSVLDDTERAARMGAAGRAWAETAFSEAAFLRALRLETNPLSGAAAARTTLAMGGSQ